MKIYYVAEIDSYYEFNELGYPDLHGKIITEETPLLDKGIFANAADAYVLIRDLLQEKKAEWEQNKDYDPVIVGNWVYYRRDEMEAHPNCFTGYCVRERNVIGS